MHMEAYSMRSFALIILLAATTALVGQEAPQRFSFEAKPANVSGTDTYTLSKSTAGYIVSGTSEMKSAQGVIEMRHSEELGPAWEFKQYKFSAKVNGDDQKIEAVRK